MATSTKKTTTVKSPSSKSNDTIKYNPNTGQKLKAGESVKDTQGRTLTQGQSLSKTLASQSSPSSSSGKSSSSGSSSSSSISSSNLKKGSSGSEVSALQQSLKNAGYNINVDGIFGSQTDNVVRQYQKASGLAVDGIAGINTKTKLGGGSSAPKINQNVYADPSSAVAGDSQSNNPFTSTLRTGSSGDQVASLQKILNSFGSNLVVDGKYGPKTEAAVREYQAKNGLTADGIFGQQTSGSLTTAINAAGDPNAQPPGALVTEYGKVDPNAPVTLDGIGDPTFPSDLLGGALTTQDVFQKRNTYEDTINSLLAQQASAYAALNQTKATELQGTANILYGRNGAGANDLSLQGAELERFNREMAFKTVPAEIAYNSAQMALSLFKQSPAYLTETQARDTAFNMLQNYPDINYAYNPNLSAQDNLQLIKQALPSSQKYQASLVSYSGYTDPNGVFHMYNTKDVDGNPLGGPNGLGVGLSLQDAIAQQESGGNYKAVNKSSGALGKYQIMPFNLQAFAGIADTPANRQAFLNNPNLQEQTFQRFIASLNKKYNGDTIKVLAAYYGGDKAAQIVGTPAGDKPQKGGFPSINEYVNEVYGRMNGSGDFSSPTPYNPAPSSTNPVTPVGMYLGSSGGSIQEVAPIDRPVNKTQVEFVTNWQSGDLGKTKTSLNTAIGHLFEADSLFNNLNNTKYPGVNKGLNYLKTKFGSSAATDYEIAQSLASNELSAAYGGNTSGERDKLSAYGGSQQSPTQHAGYITTATNLLASKISAIAEQYKAAFGHYPPSLDSLISPINQVKLQAFAGTKLTSLVKGVPLSPSTQALLNSAQVNDTTGEIRIPKGTSGEYEYFK